MNEEQERKWCVYKHTNKINGKVYIGQTCQDPEQRWGNGEKYRSCVLFYRAIKKYGWDNFNHEIIAKNLTKTEADFLEQDTIKKYKTTDANYGYNLKEGGSHGKYTESSKLKMSRNHSDVSKEKNPMYGKHHTKETIEKIKIAKQIYNSNNKRPPMSQETKNKISKANKGKRRTIEQKQKIRSSLKTKPVICIETGICYKGACEIEEKLGLNHSSIIRCCKGKQKTCGGYHWKYMSDIKDDELIKVNRSVIKEEF